MKNTFQSLFSQYFHSDADEFPANPPAPSATPVPNLDDDFSNISSTQTSSSNMSTNHTELSGIFTINTGLKSFNVMLFVLTQLF